jgi:hypothetical protein
MLKLWPGLRCHVPVQGEQQPRRAAGRGIGVFRPVFAARPARLYAAIAGSDRKDFTSRRQLDLARVDRWIVRCTDATRRKQAMRSPRLWLFGLALSTATIVAEGEPVSVRVNPSVAVAPTSLAISVNVAPQSHNRALEIVVDSGDFYRLSRVQLEGDRAPVVNTMKVASVPAGEYEVTATVIGDDGRRGVSARAHAEVMGTSPR